MYSPIECWESESGCPWSTAGCASSALALCNTWYRKSMYLVANFNVWIFDSLSEGRVGIILRREANASLRLCVRCRSRTLAITRWLCISSGVCGDRLLDLEGAWNSFDLDDRFLPDITQKLYEKSYKNYCLIKNKNIARFCQNSNYQCPWRKNGW